MIEGRMQQGILLRKLFDSIKEMLNDINLECSDSGIGVQAMDASHVALISVSLLQGAFDYYTCSNRYSLGLNMTQVSKVMKLCCQNDAVILRHDPAKESERISFVFESPGERKISDFNLRLMNFDADNLGIPPTEYDATVNLSSKAFVKVISDLSQFSDTISIEINSKGVRFCSDGDFGSGHILFRAQQPNAAKSDDDAIVESKIPEVATEID
uniref:DNA sliding clamp PCNA n=1 Tax=Dermatophagoides pteronyssinus TaxID=6956 RepID=A0A6P6Y794_DERPT|nr:proliferating cell nuclear antigen-like [Dermatophagoides pteronyssinus]